jgi:hypothetical protein
LKKDIESELPYKVEKVIKIRMSALQSQLYKQMKKHKMIADGKDSKWYVVIAELLLSTYLILMPFQRKSGVVFCLAQLGPKALALAWPEVALAFPISGPSQSCQT